MESAQDLTLAEEHDKGPAAAELSRAAAWAAKRSSPELAAEQSQDLVSPTGPSDEGGEGPASGREHGHGQLEQQQRLLHRECVRRLQQLTTEKQQMEDEFNTQRAKMKELFLQKEEAARAACAEAARLQLDLDELRALLHDTVEESGSEVEQLRARLAQAPPAPPAPSRPRLHQHPQEGGGEGALVDALREELRALKDKLRRTDAELQRQQQQPQQQPQQQQQPAADGAPCDMCRNYEAQLVSEQARANKLHYQLQATSEELEEAGARATEALAAAGEARGQLEAGVARAEAALQQAQAALAAARASSDLHRRATLQRLTKLTVEGARLAHEAARLRDHVHALSARYLASARALLDAEISLPDGVAELQEALLAAHEARVLAAVQQERAAQQERSVREELLRAHTQLHDALQHHDQLQARAAALEAGAGEAQALAARVRDLTERLHQATARAESAEARVAELGAQAGALRASVASGERVQHELVRLTQQLQRRLDALAPPEPEPELPPALQPQPQPQPPAL